MEIDIKTLNKSMSGQYWIEEFLGARELDDIQCVTIDSMEHDIRAICDLIRENGVDQTIVIYRDNKKSHNV